MKRSLICCGDSTDIKTWSNIPYFVLKAGIKNGLLSQGLQLKPEELVIKKYLWNLKQLLKTGKIGGFQYSNLFNNELLKQGNLDENSYQSILSHFPSIPSYPWPNKWNVAFYIDATTKQIFNYYNSGSMISKSFKEEIIRKERVSYEHAYAIICMSDWAANSIINDYEIDSGKVYVVPGGANLDEDQLTKIEVSPPPQAPSKMNPLKIGFLGKEWQRKGGPFLLEIVEELNKFGIPAVIRAIGPDKKELPNNEYIQPLGFINKQKNTLLFASEISSWHFGSLFSSAEAFGISNRECMRLGTPVLTHDIGGISSTFPYDFCGKLFKGNPKSYDVTNWVINHIIPYENYLQNRIKLTDHYNKFTWDESIKKLQTIIKQ